MSEKLFEGKTQAQWILLRSPSRDLDWKFAVSQLKVQEALLWFSEQDSAARIAREDSRFRLTCLFAGLALVVSASSLFVSILALKRPPHIATMQPQALAPTSTAAIQTATNAAISKANIAAQPKP